MADVFTLLDWVGALLLAGALAMVALTHKEMWVARLLLLSGSFLTIIRWAMWSFVTDARWPLRATVGAVLGALLLAAAPALWQWTREREASHAGDAVDGPPKVRPEIPQHLTRSLAYDNISITLTQENNSSALRGIGGIINNVGQDTIHARIQNFVPIRLAQDTLSFTR